MSEAEKETYLFVFLNDEYFRLCVNGGQRQRKICFVHILMLLKQTKTQEGRRSVSIRLSETVRG